MTNFNISNMNCQELAQMIAEHQKLAAEHQKLAADYQMMLDTNNQKIAELKNTVFEALQKIKDLCGNSDFVSEIAQQFIENNTVEEEQAQPDEEPLVTVESDTHYEGTSEPESELEGEEENLETEEQNTQDFENEYPETEEDLFEPMDDILKIDRKVIIDSLNNDCPLDIVPEDDLDEEPEDPVEYRNKEEYELAKKRAKMMQPLDFLMSDNISPNIQMIGYAVPPVDASGKKTPFLQNERIINSRGCGNTLTASARPKVYIPMPKRA